MVVQVLEDHVVRDFVGEGRGPDLQGLELLSDALTHEVRALRQGLTHLHEDWPQLLEAFPQRLATAGLLRRVLPGLPDVPGHAPDLGEAPRHHEGPRREELRELLLGEAAANQLLELARAVVVERRRRRLAPGLLAGLRLLRRLRGGWVRCLLPRHRPRANPPLGQEGAPPANRSGPGRQPGGERRRRRRRRDRGRRILRGRGERGGGRGGGDDGDDAEPPRLPEGLGPPAQPEVPGLPRERLPVPGGHAHPDRLLRHEAGGGRGGRGRGRG
mmetsp:Transcript_15921/g.47780  ORF Transcript_15921/g.47780 Transcript_15921/m.47780 type:complete len:272 (-) Transcript_15921:188-1003(-)